MNILTIPKMLTDITEYIKLENIIMHFLLLVLNSDENQRLLTDQQVNEASAGYVMTK